MNEKVFQFIEWDEFYRHYQPLTPYGQQQKQAKKVYNSLELLQTDYDLQEKCLQFRQANPQTADSCEYHLKRIPELNSLTVHRFDSTDLFLIKKFLLNYRRLNELLSAEFKSATDFTYNSENLLKLLCIDGTQDEVFYLSEKYLPQLAEVRAEIKKIDQQIREERKNRLTEILTRFNLDFRFKDFLVLPESSAVLLDRNFVYLETYDNSQVVVKPVLTESYYQLHLSKEELVKTEKSLEKEVLSNISAEVKKEINQLIRYIEITEKIDIIFAKARLTQKFDLLRPRLMSDNDKLEITNGRLLPLVDRCEKNNLHYQPLNLQLAKRLMVLNGSNMGGKTILLKTVLFLQTMAQFGFFVAAESYSTAVFDQLAFIGESAGSNIEGLSSFGLEIYNFMEHYQKKDQRILFIVDEFARTTNSREALALLSAVLKAFDENAKISALFSTHFMDLPQYENLAFYRMKGLDREAYRNYYHKAADLSLPERIRLINNFMQYAAEPDDRQNPPYDALLIAEILGLDMQIIENARANVNCDLYD